MVLKIFSQICLRRIVQDKLEGLHRLRNITKNGGGILFLTF